MNTVEVIVAAPGRYVDDAARIRAEATTAREGDTEIPSLDVARPLIAGVLNRSPSYQTHKFSVTQLTQKCKKRGNQYETLEP